MAPTSDSESQREEVLDRLVNEYYQASERGSAPDPRAFIADHPEFADELREFFSDIGQLQQNMRQEEADREPADSRGDAATRAAAMERPGTVIGPYKLLQKLGEGGMGAVYLAEQQQPVRRQVALKIIKAGMDSAQVLARFEQERQALAMMDHPNIARIIDAGTTDEVRNAECGMRNEDQRSSGTPHSAFRTPHLPAGRPYFVMELVKGIPITRYCDQEHLSPKERLELFIPVCQAVQHAHQKGIIHRDLKPSNVLIALYDGRPIPKVIDFGVAKATSQKLTERTLFTEVGSIVGTLEYMAPEQAELNNLDVDTRADVYSLGVLLYELLAGAPPFSSQQLRSVGFNEMLRIIKEVEPPRPSTRLSSSDELPSIAANRKLEPARLTKAVRGDLDWIVMKCLEKERGRRYETANALATDVRHYLDNDPVLAGPPSAAYRLGKLISKHRAGFMTAMTVVLVLIMATIVSLSQWLRASRERDRAVGAERLASERLVEVERANAETKQALNRSETDREQAEAISRVLVRGINTFWDQGTFDLLDLAMTTLGDDFAGSPTQKADLLDAIGIAYSVWEPDKAIPLLEQAYSIRREHNGPDHRQTLESVEHLAVAYLSARRHSDAIALLEATRIRARTMLGVDNPRVLRLTDYLGDAHRAAGHSTDLVPDYQYAIQRRGFVQDWLVLVGPSASSAFDNDRRLDFEYLPGEARLQPRAGEAVQVGDLAFIWQQHHSNDYFVNFKSMSGAPESYGAGYAVCYVVADEARHALQLRIGSDDHVKVYLNGEQVFRNPAIRGIGRDQDRAKNIRLRQGTNVLVLKVVDIGGEWQGCVRFVQENGEAVKGIRVQLTP